MSVISRKWCPRQKLSPHCLEAIFDSQLPSPKLSPKMPPKRLSPTREGFLSSFKINPAVRVIARQVRDKNCFAAIFAPRHQSVSSGPLGKGVVAKGFEMLQGPVSRRRKQKIRPKYWAQQYIRHWERHSQGRHTFLQNPLLKTPLSRFLKIVEVSVTVHGF